MDADDIQGAVSILWPVRRAGWGLGPDPLGPPWALLRITQTFSHSAAHFLIMIVAVLSVSVIGVEQRCFHLVAAPA